MDWQGFFEGYATASISGTAEEMAAFYAEGFVAAGPEGAFGGLNDEKFLAWLGRVRQVNEERGMQSLRPAEVREESAVGPHHRLVSVRWATQFEATGERSIEFTISYLLHLKGPRIVAYVSHESEAGRVEAEGLAQP